MTLEVKCKTSRVILAMAGIQESYHFSIRKIFEFYTRRISVYAPGKHNAHEESSSGAHDFATFLESLLINKFQFFQAYFLWRNRGD